MSDNLSQALRQPHSILLDNRTSTRALLAVPILLAIIIVLWVADLHTAYDHPLLSEILGFFQTLAALIVVLMVWTSFLKNGEPGLLMLGCGVLLWGIGGSISSAVLGRGVNAAVTIHNSLSFLAALCHFYGVAVSRKWRPPMQMPLVTVLILTCAVLLFVAGVITILALHGSMPVFFVQGKGGTLIRQIVLALAIIFFGLSSAALWKANRQRPSAFFRWYGAALLLLSTGLLGVMLQPAVAGLLGWTGRTAQYLGGIYMIVAAVASVRETGFRGLSLAEALQQSEEQYRSLFNTMIEGFCVIEMIFDEDGRPVDYRFLEVNPAFEKQTGLYNAQGKLIRELIPDLETHWIEICGRVALTGEPERVVNEARALNRWYDVSAFRAGGPESRKVAFLFNDITESKRAAEEAQRLHKAVADEKDRLSALLNSISDEIWFADMEGDFVLVNSSASREFSLGSADAIDIKKLAGSLEVLRSDGTVRPIEETPPLRALHGEIIRNQEEIIRTPLTEELRYRQVSSTPVRNSVGNIIGSVSVVRDITDLKNAEKAIRENEERLRLVLQASSMGTFEVDILTGKGRWNAMEFELLGLRPGDAIPGPETFFRYVHPDDAGLLRAQWEEALRSGNLDAEFRVVRADGEVRWLAGKGQFIYDSNRGREAPETINQGVKYMGVNFDITGRKRAEEALQQNENRYRMLHESMRDAFVQVDMAGRIIAFNGHYCNMLGYTPEEMRSLTYQQVTPERWHAFEKKIVLEQIIARGYSDIYEKEYRRKDGTVFPVELRTILSRDQRGQPTAMWGIVRDVTERKREEETLRESETRYRAVVENTTAIILRVAPSGMITFANSRALKFFGYSPDELIGKHAVGTIIPEKETTGRDLVGMVDQIVSHPDRFHSNTNENLCKDGRRVWMEWTNSGIYDTQGLLKEVLSVGIDSTDRKRAEEALRTAYEEMEARVEERTADLKRLNESMSLTNKALEDFSHVASHDLQEPLRKIITFSERLADSDMGRLTDQSRDYLTRMQTAAARMQTLIRDLAKYSRVTSSPSHFKVVNLKRPAEEAVMDLNTLLEETGGRVEIDELPDVRANETQMRHLFQNLIGNALKYRSSLTPIIRIYNRPSSEDGFNEICVEDNGIGFDEMYLNKIFKPFQRLHGKSSPYPGTGMGLAICQKIIEFHGGSLTAKSEPGKGSTFIVKLPKAH